MNVCAICWEVSEEVGSLPHHRITDSCKLFHLSINSIAHSQFVKCMRRHRCHIPHSGRRTKSNGTISAALSSLSQAQCSKTFILVYAFLQILFLFLLLPRIQYNRFFVFNASAIAHFLHSIWVRAYALPLAVVGSLMHVLIIPTDPISNPIHPSPAPILWVHTFFIVSFGR